MVEKLPFSPNNAMDWFGGRIVDSTGSVTFLGGRKKVDEERKKRNEKRIECTENAERRKVEMNNHALPNQVQKKRK